MEWGGGCERGVVSVSANRPELFHHSLREFVLDELAGVLNRPSTDACIHHAGEDGFGAALTSLAKPDTD